MDHVDNEVETFYIQLQEIIDTVAKKDIIFTRKLECKS